MMQKPIDLFARSQQEIAEQAAADERARVQNVQRFTQMWLTLGVDVIKAAGSNHQAEIAEALGIATNRWGRLLDAEAQIQREEQELAGRPKKRGTAPGDEFLAPEVIKRQASAYEDETRSRHDSLVLLKEQARAERRELESFTKGR